MATYVRCSEYLPVTQATVKEKRKEWESFLELTYEIQNSWEAKKRHDEYCTRFMQFSRRHGESPFHCAAKYNDEHSIRRIARITKRQFLNIGDSKGQTPLHYAAYWGSCNAVETLIRLGAPINAMACLPEEGLQSGDSVLAMATCYWRLYKPKENREGRIQCAMTLRNAGAEYEMPPSLDSDVRREWLGQDLRYSVDIRLKRVADRMDIVYKAPALKVLPMEVLDLVARFANLPDRNIVPLSNQKDQHSRRALHLRKL